MNDGTGALFFIFSMLSIFYIGYYCGESQYVKKDLIDKAKTLCVQAEGLSEINTLGQFKCKNKLKGKIK